MTSPPPPHDPPPHGPPPHGPGVRLLAERAGVEPEALLRDPAGLLRALADAARDTADLAHRLASPDADVVRAAEEEARALREHFADPPSPGQLFGSSVAAALRDAAERVRSAGEQPEEAGKES